MAITVRKNLVSSSKYKTKCPYPMNAEFITFHNTAMDAPAKNEISYMIGNNNQVSYHFAVDDHEVVQGIPTNRMAWHCGDGVGKGNMKSIGVEVCYSRSGGTRYAKAEALGIAFVAQLLHERGWGVDRVKPHQFWSGKNCPHRVLNDKRWNSVVARIQNELNKLQGKPITIVRPPSVSKGYLIKGDTGQQVKRLQELLNKAGYDAGVADGIFGTKTEKAVIKLQEDNKIKVDGIAGNGTMQVLEALTTTFRPDKGTSTKDYLYVGDKGNEVKQLQINLNKVLNINLDEDGIFGEDTKNAVKDFQRKFDLRVDGYYGKNSKSKLKEALNKEEESKLADKAIVINSFIDYPAVQKLHIRTGYGIWERKGIKTKVAKELIVAGGGTKGLEKFADKLTDLSGKSREETVEKVADYTDNL